MKRITSIANIVILIVIDQVSKASGKNNPGQIFIHQGVLWDNKVGQLTNVKIGIGLCLLVILGWLLFNKKENNWLIKDKSNQILVGLIVIIAGGVSNMLDWLLYGGIMNIFNLGPLSFNVADIYILIGALLFLSPRKFSWLAPPAQP